jgi:hypothetical protein
LTFKEDGTLVAEIGGDIECQDSYGSKSMDSKTQKINWCDDQEGLLTIKSNTLIMCHLKMMMDSVKSLN